MQMSKQVLSDDVIRNDVEIDILQSLTKSVSKMRSNLVMVIK